MSTNSKKLGSIRRQVGHAFDFLLSNGFVISYADYSAELFGNWAVELSSPALRIHISNDRDFIAMELSRPGEDDPSTRTPLERVLDTANAGLSERSSHWGKRSGDQKQQLLDLAKVLEAHLDEVLEFVERSAP